MPAPHSVEIRRQIVKRHEKGETLKSISREMNIPYISVKSVWRHWRVHKKLEPNYEKASEKGTRLYTHIYPEAIAMKKAHRRWGAGLIRVELRKQFPNERLPSERTLQRWFREAGIGTSPKVQQCRQGYVRRGQLVHQVWAIDAKERMRLANGSGASWMVITDEASGAMLSGQAFPPVSVDPG